MLDRVDPRPEHGSDLFLTPGLDNIEYGGKTLKCMSRCVDPDGYVFAEHPDAAGVVLTTKRFWSDFRSGLIRFCAPSEMALPAKVRESLRRTLGAYRPTERRNIVTRLRFVMAVVARDKLGPLPRTKEAWQPICSDVANEHGYAEPHWSSVYRWYRLYSDADGDPCVLSGLDRYKGNRERKLTPTQLDALDAALPSFLRMHRPKYATAQHAVNGKLIEANGGKDGVKFVGYGAVRASLLRLGREVRLHHREGPDAARQEITPAYAGPLVTLPFQRVETDFKYLGLFVVDERSGLPLGTPMLMAAIDCFSGAVAGFDIGFDPPSTASASRCLRHVIENKTFDRYLKDADGDCVIKGTWPINGVPQQFVLDNDQAFHAESFRMAAKVLGCDLKFLGPGEPSKKGTIESLWRTVQDSYVGMFPGRVLRVWKRPSADHKPQDDAVVTLSELRTFIAKAFVDVHNVTEDAKSGRRRIDRWLDGVRAHRPRPVRSHEDVIELVGAYASLKASRKGIRMSGLAYNSDVLARHRADFPEDPTVEVRYTPDDLGRVWVVDAERGRSFAVPSTWPEYTDGLSLHQHRVIRNRAVSRGAQGVIYRHELLAAKAELNNLGQAMLKDKKVGRRSGQRIARYFGMTPEAVASASLHPWDEEKSRGAPLAADTRDLADDEDEFDDTDALAPDGPREVGEAERSIEAASADTSRDEAPTPPVARVQPRRPRRTPARPEERTSSPAGPDPTEVTAPPEAPASTEGPAPTDAPAPTEAPTQSPVDDRTVLDRPPAPRMKVFHVKRRDR